MSSLQFLKDRSLCSVVQKLLHQIIYQFINLKFRFIQIILVFSQAFKETNSSFLNISKNIFVTNNFRFSDHNLHLTKIQSFAEMLQIYICITPLEWTLLAATNISLTCWRMIQTHTESGLQSF